MGKLKDKCCRKFEKKGKSCCKRCPLADLCFTNLEVSLSSTKKDKKKKKKNKKDE